MYKNNGFSLLEVLIAVFIFVFGLVSISSLSISSVRRMQNNYWSTVAASYLNSFADCHKVSNLSTSKCKGLFIGHEITTTSQEIKICRLHKQKYECQAIRTKSE